MAADLVGFYNSRDSNPALSTATMPPSTSECSIEVRSLLKRYSRAKTAVLSGLTLNVQKGHIYGLLGPSGCGKTTLLKCIVGRIRPDSGFIRVMGERPGKLGHKVPGSLIGYMPQDLALYQEFTISETMFYFGRIFGMDSAKIQERLEFLTELLKLPKQDKMIYRLSGGQQRRVSFACALLHEPPLLILDEPTVGVDPLLRQCIWNHLKTIVSDAEKPTSVLITTHYIEEAREGHMVALMRDGKLLAESSPESLLKQYKETSLESTFLKLCYQAAQKGNQDQQPSEEQQLSDSRITQTNNSSGNAEDSAVTNNSNHSTIVLDVIQTNGKLGRDKLELRDPAPKFESLRSFLALPSPRRVVAVIIKDFTNMIRRIGFLLFQFSLPVLQIVLFCLCIGPDPKDLPVAVVNNDVGNLSSNFVNSLDGSKLKKVFFSDLQSARAEVRSAKAWSVLHFGQNFSSSLTQRLTNPAGLSNESLSQGSIHLAMDNTNYQVSAVLRQAVTEQFQSFIGDMLEELGRPRTLASLPIEYQPPLLGGENPTFTEFMAPGMIITILFFLATGLTAVSFVAQRKEGLLDRSLVAGVTVLELMLGHMLTELVIMSVQTALLLTVCLAGFQLSCHGSVPLVIMLAMSIGCCGMALGLFISVLCSNENSAMQAALGTMYPCLLLSGIMWPAEGMPAALWYISKALPTTLSAEALRAVMNRGFDMTAFSVWLGFVSSVAWSALLLLLSLLLIKLKGI